MKRTLTAYEIPCQGMYFSASNVSAYSFIFFYIYFTEEKFEVFFLFYDKQFLKYIFLFSIHLFNKYLLSNPYMPGSFSCHWGNVAELSRQTFLFLWDYIFFS